MFFDATKLSQAGSAVIVTSRQTEKPGMELSKCFNRRQGPGKRVTAYDHSGHERRRSDAFGAVKTDGRVSSDDLTYPNSIRYSTMFGTTATFHIQWPRDLSSPTSTVLREAKLRRTVVPGKTHKKSAPLHHPLTN